MSIQTLLEMKHSIFLQKKTTSSKLDPSCTKQIVEFVECNLVEMFSRILYGPID